MKMNDSYIPYTQRCPYESIKNNIRNMMPLTSREFETVRYSDIWFLIDVIALYNEMVVYINEIIVTPLVPLTPSISRDSIKHQIRYVQPLTETELEFTSNAEIPFLLELIGIYNDVIIEINLHLETDQV